MSNKRDNKRALKAANGPRKGRLREIPVHQAYEDVRRGQVSDIAKNAMRSGVSRKQAFYEGAKQVDAQDTGNWQSWSIWHGNPEGSSNFGSIPLPHWMTRG